MNAMGIAAAMVKEPLTLNGQLVRMRNNKLKIRHLQINYNFNMVSY